MLSFGREKRRKEDWQTQGRAVATLKERANASLEVIICVAALLGIGTVMGTAMTKRWEERQQAFSDRFRHLHRRNFSGIAVIKAFVKELKELMAFRS